MSVYQIVYDNAAALSFNSTFVEVTGGAVQLKDLGGGTYSLVPQLVTSQFRLPVSAISAFTEIEVPSASTSCTYQIVLGDGTYWYNVTSSMWEESDGTSAQANSASDVNANAATLFSDLGILVPQYLGLRVWLTTILNSVTPVLGSNTITAAWTNSSVPAINECLLTANIIDLLGVIPTLDPLRPSKLTVSADAAFLHGSRLVLPFTKEATFDANGELSISIIETTTPGVKLSFDFTFYDGYSKATTVCYKAMVPNEPTAGINSLTFPLPYDFG